MPAIGPNMLRCTKRHLAITGVNFRPMPFMDNKTFNHEKSLMFKYGRMQKKISSRLVCGSHGVCLDCKLPGVQVTAGLGFFSVFKSFV